MPKISVIIPVYNVEKYLAECLTSVVNQTFKDIEIICVNDGSTDNSPMILEEFAQKDSRIKIINQENQGMSCARNAGLAVATGEYITFVDSDDYIELKTYETIFNSLKQTPDLICFGTNIIEQEIKRFEHRNKYYDIKFSGLQKATCKHLKNTDVSVWNKIFKASIIKKYNIIFPSKLHYEDYSFVNKYFICCKDVFYIKEKLYNYRRRPNSIMDNVFKNKSERILDHLIIFNDFFNFCKDNYFLESNKNYVEISFLYCFDFCIHFLSPQDYDKVFELSQKILRSTEIEFRNKRIKAILNNNKKIAIDKTSFWNKIFSLKNQTNDGYKDKILTLLGLQIKLKSKPIWEHKPKVLVHLHLYYLDQLDYMLKKLKNINSCDWDLFVTMTKQDEQAIQKLKGFKPDVHIIQVEDKGFDVWPFLQVLNLVDLSNYDDILKIHTKKYRKKKDFYGRGNAWRNYLIDALLGSRKQFQKNIHLMQMDKSVGLIGSRATLATMGCSEKDDSILFDEMCQSHGIPISKGRFIAGTMFLVRAKCFQRIKDMNFKSEDFNHIQQTSGRKTTAHTLERLLSRIVEVEGYKIATVRSAKYSILCTIKIILRTIFSISNLPRKSENEPKTKVITILGLKFTKEKK